MNKKIIYACLLIVITFTGCEDFFESTITIDPPEAENLLFISATIGIDDEDIHASVTRTVPIAAINDPIGSSILTDADVRISKEGSGEEIVLDYEQFAQRPVLYNAEIPNGFYQAGESYTFSAEHPSYPRAFVTEQFPEKVEINALVFEENGGVNEEGDARSRISVSFQDPPGKQYYEIVVYEEDANPNNPKFRSTYSDSTDPSVSRGSLRHSNIIDDGLFEGENKTIALRVYPHTEQLAKKQLWVGLRTISESYYNFSKTKYARDEFGDDNPFQSPVQLYSNVNNGLGVVAFYVEEIEKY